MMKFIKCIIIAFLIEVLTMFYFYLFSTVIKPSNYSALGHDKFSNLK